MSRLNLDSAAPAVKNFLRSVSIVPNGIEIELDGKVVCKIVPPSELSEAEKDSRLADVRDLLKRSRMRSKRASRDKMDRDIREAMAGT
jgi:hypothetical protein